MKRKILSRLMAFALCFIMIATVIPPVTANAAVVKPEITLKATIDGGVTIKWTSAGSEDEVSYYKIFRAKDVDGSAGTYFDLGIRIESYEDRIMEDWECDPNIKYYYRVNAYNNKDNRVAQSAAKSVVTKLYTPMIDRVVHDAATGSPIITWTQSYKADRYYIYRSKSASGTFNKIGTATKE